MPRQIPFIDIHTHLFNGRYLPLHGILRSWGVPRLTAWALSVLLVPLVGKSRFASGGRTDADQTDILDALAEGRINRSYGSLLERLGKKLLSTAKTAADERSDRETLEEMTEALSALYAQFVDKEQKFKLTPDYFETMTATLAPEDDTPSALLSDLDRIMMPTLVDAARGAEGNGYFAEHSHGGDEPDHTHDETSAPFGNEAFPAQQAGTVLQMLVFFLSMFLSERNRYTALQRDYARDKPADGHDPLHMVALLPDMRRAYERTVSGRLRPPYYRARDQVARGAALARESGGVLIPFGTIDPFRGERWKENVRYAQDIGITGFKIYPPMGFKPTSTLPVSADPLFAPIELSPKEKYKVYVDNLSVANDPLTEQVMGEVISHAAQNDLRLFTHCTPLGFEAKTGFGTNCHPAWWAAAMEEYGAQNLRLCLGHGGGATEVDFGGWLAETEEDWHKTMAYRGILMCQRYPNVYMGLGYLIPLLENEKNRTRVLDRLKAVLTSEQSSEHRIADKLIFGTDWSMPLIIGKTRSFLNVFYDFFARPEFCKTEIPDRVMRQNAQEYLGLPVT